MHNFVYTKICIISKYYERNIKIILHIKAQNNDIKFQNIFFIYKNNRVSTIMYDNLKFREKFCFFKKVNLSKVKFVLRRS